MTSNTEIEGPQPSPERVAARAIVLSAVTCRGSIEKDANERGAEKLRKSTVDWLYRIGADREMESQELALLSTPLGELEKKRARDATWVSEGLVVLAWALRRAPLPVFHVECEPSDVANAIGFLADRGDTILANPQLREANEITVEWEKYLTLHWRLRQFSIEPGIMDLVAYVSSCEWGPLRLNDIGLCDGDLAVEGVRIDRLEYFEFRRVLSLVQERHRAFNWLRGWDPVYSEVTTDT